MAEQQIVAGSAGLIYDPHYRTSRYSPVMQYATALAEVAMPNICYLGTAKGDDEDSIRDFYDASWTERVKPTHLSLFPRPSVANVKEHLLNQDVIWVAGGSVANLLAVWRVHELDKIMEEAWNKGVILGGVSAGSICWHQGGTTDSFGSDLRPVTNGLNLLPFASGVHYGSEPQRRPLFQKLISEGIFQEGYGTDDGAAIHFAGAAVHKVISGRVGSHAYHVQKTDEGVKETRLKSEYIGSFNKFISKASTNKAYY